VKYLFTTPSHDPPGQDGEAHKPQATSTAPKQNPTANTGFHRRRKSDGNIFHHLMMMRSDATAREIEQMAPTE
jgi:hypothetical protein